MGRNRFEIVITLISISTLLMVLACNKEDLNTQEGVRVGDYLPEFSLKNSTGDTVRLSDFKNKTVLIEMWASWCGYCNTEAPELNDIYDKFKSYDFEIVGISIDEDKNSWKNKVQSHNINYTQVNDARGFNSPVVKDYKVESIPKMFLLNEEGRILLITTKAAVAREYLDRIYQ